MKIATVTSGGGGRVTVRLEDGTTLVAVRARHIADGLSYGDTVLLEYVDGDPTRAVIVANVVGRVATELAGGSA